MSGTKWTLGDREKLMAMYLDGKSYQEIADFLGRSRKGVDQQIYSMKLSGLLTNRKEHSTWSSEDESKLVNAIRAGLKHSQIVQTYFPTRSVESIKMKIFQIREHLKGR